MKRRIPEKERRQRPSDIAESAPQDSMPLPSTNPFAAVFQAIEHEDKSSPSPPQIQLEEVAKYLVSDDLPGAPHPKSSSVFQCGPHHDCCGGFYNVAWQQFTRCQKRINQHARGQVCLTSHSYSTCTMCSKVLHHGCWVPKADGTYVLPGSMSFQCFECDCKKNVKNCAARKCTL
jgi:hypothetical protein